MNYTSHEFGIVVTGAGLVGSRVALGASRGSRVAALLSTLRVSGLTCTSLSLRS